ncbi:hypothetical protein PR048_012238 [Dryococelus australis]|uniref:Uncharacterized protein n=1 Tax=Dryococelus australis TaxID=614101 RepID=A0ABQ9HNX7_9NEOP|nr:hypothetical protein PR048_012238 [Dryococelus australis]
MGTFSQLHLADPNFATPCPNDSELFPLILTASCLLEVCAGSPATMNSLNYPWLLLLPQMRNNVKPYLSKLIITELQIVGTTCVFPSGQQSQS